MHSEHEELKLIHIVGRQNNGKTTLIVDLIQELKKRGLRVGTLKHSSHVHELDKPGKDSFQHRHAGGVPAAVVTRNMMAVYLPREEYEDPLQYLQPMFRHADLVLVEGFIDGPGKKLEVWRREIGTKPLIEEKTDILAIITDDPISTSLPVLPRSGIGQIADFITSLI